MRRCISIIATVTLLGALSGIAWGQTYLIQEGFSTTSLPSGWSGDVYFNSTANVGNLTGDNGAGFNDNDKYLRLPSVNSPGTLTFWMKGSDASSQISLKVRKSVGGGAFVDIATFPKPHTTSATQKTVAINDNSDNVVLKFVSYERTGNSIYLDDIQLTAFSSEPTTQASSLNFTDVGTNSFTINWTSGNGSNRLIVVKSGSAVAGTPVDGTSYTANTTFGSGDPITTGEYVVYNGTGSSVAITGLSAATTYHVAVFEFNGSGGSQNYLTTSPATGSQATNEASSPTITVNPSSLTGYTYAEGSGPSSEQTFTVSGAYLTNDISIAASTNFEISKTSGSGYASPLTLTQSGGTVSETTIYVRLKAGLSVGSYSSENIVCSSSGADNKNVTCSGTVTTPEPTNHASSFAASLGSPSYGKITLTWTDASGGTAPDGYLIKASTTSYDAISSPVDGTTEADVLLKRNINQGVQTASFGDLDANTTYYFKIFPYKGSGTNINFKIDGSVPQISKKTDNLPTNLLLERNFDFSGKLTDYGWTAHSGGGTNPIQSTNGLTYNGYPCSGIGNAASLGNTGEDVNFTFSSQTSGSVFVTFLVKVTSASTTSDYFLNLGPNVISSTYRGRVFVIKDTGSENIAFGLNLGSGSASVLTAYSYSLNTTYLIGLKYEIVSGTTNDVCLLYTSPSPRDGLLSRMPSSA